MYFYFSNTNPFHTYFFPWSTKPQIPGYLLENSEQASTQKLFGVFFHYREVLYLISFQPFKNTKEVQATVTVAAPLGFSAWMITKRQITPQKPRYSQDSHQSDELAEYERDKSSNSNSFRWVPDNSWEVQVCCVGSTFRIHLCHVCFSYQREIKTGPSPFITSSTWTELYSYYYNS